MEPNHHVLTELEIDPKGSLVKVDTPSSLAPFQSLAS